MHLSFPEIFQYVIFSVGIASLGYGSYTDIRTRTVKAFLFIPLAILGLIFNYIVSAPEMYIILGIVAFLFTFLEPDTYAYGIIGVIVFALATLSFLEIGFYWGFELLVIAVVYLLGFQERLFGIGDIKAIIALAYSSPFYSPLVGMLVGGSIDYTLVPTGLSLLTDISFFAVIFVIYALFLLRKHGTVRINGQLMAIRYDEKLEGKKPSAYVRKEKNGVHYLVYRLPFIVPIALGYVLFLLTGFVLFIL